MNEHIDDVELTVGDLPAAKAVYASAFGWGFRDPAGNELGVWSE